jgi:CheY-like chemotaxis protein
MSQQQIAGLFRPFTQADESTTRRFGGTGLGLVISKRLAQLLGGDITVQSELGSGTCFSIWVDSGQLGGVRMLPALDEADLVSEALPQSRASQRFIGKILVAEDGEDNQHLIGLLLRNAGLESTIVSNGRLAMEKALSGNFDLILMDMQMPEMDGYSATRALRDKGYKGPICALTANAMADDRARCISAGCDEYIAKPIRIELLGRVLSRFLKQQPQQPSDAEAALAAGAACKLRSSLSNNETLKGVLERFVSRLPQRIEDIQRLLRERDLAHLAQAVHQMKGAAGGYGFPQLTSAAGKAEESIKRADDIASISQQINELVSLIHQVDGFPESAIPASVAKPSTAAPAKENAPRLRVDPETGLPNRNHMLERLSTLIALARRRGGPLACIAIQVRMAQPNPVVFKRVAALLESCCQQHHELFRVDASNFMLVAPDQDSTAVQEYGSEVERRLASDKFTDLTGPGGPALAMAVSELRLTTMSAAELSEEAIKSLAARQAQAA